MAPKPIWQKRVLDFCRTHPGFEDVASICDIAAHGPAAKAETVNDRNEVEIGSVYLLKSGRYYKIGHSNAAGRRERELAIQLPEKAQTIHIIRTDDPRGIEEYWHKRFSAKRQNGEWFDLAAVDVAAFRRRKTM